MSQAALAIIQKGELTPVSTSTVLTVDDGMRMSPEDLHINIQACITGYFVNRASARNLIAAAKRMIESGIPVGGCTTFTAYIDLYRRAEGQSHEAAQRQTYRLLKGLGIDIKFDTAAVRHANKTKREEKEKAVADRKQKKADDKAARLKLDTAAAKAKSLKDTTHIQKLEEKLDKLEKSQAEVTATKPIPVSDVKNPVNATVAMKDANDLDQAVLILQKIVFAVDDKKRETAIKAAIKFLKYKNAFLETSEEAL